MEFTVNRKTWLRGEGDDDSYLLRGSDGKMCCLGFRAMACGHRPEDIVNHGTPFKLEYDACKWGAYVDFVGQANSAACMEAMAVNDDSDIADAERESSLAIILAKLGDTVTFVG